MNLFGHPGILATKVYQTMPTACPHTSDVALSGRLWLLVSCLVVTKFSTGIVFPESGFRRFPETEVLCF